MREHSSLKSAFFICAVVVFNFVLSFGGQAALKGGCAKVNITPPLGIPLTGSKGEPGDRILDELYAKALVLNDGSNTIAIVSADLLYVPLEEITNPIRGIVKEKTGIPEDNVLICATHTHSGPEVFRKTKLGPGNETPASKIDNAYLQTLIRQIASSVLLAYGNMEEVKVGAAKGEVPEVVYNRRPKRANGSAQMAFTLPPEVIATRRIVASPEGSVNVTFTLPPEQPELTFGPIDPEVVVLRIENTTGEMVSSLVNFACHPVSIYPSLPYSISADFPAYATRVVEKSEGGTCLFALGTAGDIVPIQRGAVPRQRIGKALGGEALRRLQFARTSGDATLSATKKAIEFPLKEPVAGNEGGDADKPPKSLTTEIQVLRIGDSYLLGLPGEILVEVGLEIKKRAGVQNLFLITLCNDVIGYVCHKEGYDEGGYEPGTGTNLAKGAGETLVKEALDLIGQIRPSP
ncbi:MAG: hypothetical protein Q8Q12_22575 [bacterium]|nr:hypothetical protein [bacterium]